MLHLDCEHAPHHRPLVMVNSAHDSVAQLVRCPYSYCPESGPLFNVEAKDFANQVGNNEKAEEGG